MKKQQFTAILLGTLTSAWLASAQEAASTAPAPADAAATNSAATNAPAPPPAPAIQADAEASSTNGLVLNFHDVPLTAVLNYLSAKAGLIIVSDVNLQGKVTVVSKQPVATNEIVQLLNDQLGKNNYSAVMDGRTLSIMDNERAKTYAHTPVRVANGTNNILFTDQIVTEIIPLHTLQAPQLVKDLSDLIPRSAVVTANEAGNSIIMTAQEKDVRRVAEIIDSLDGSAVSQVEVFKLDYADSKSVADELKEVFQSDDSQIARANTRNSFVRGAGGGGRGGGGGGFGGMGGFAAMMGGGGGGGGEEGRNVATHAVFVADDQMNAVIASAPPDYMRMITNVIKVLDQPSQEVTVLRVLKLKHADPGEISDELNNMFNPTSSTDQSTRSMGMRFMGFGGGGPFGGFGGGGGNNNNQSQRMKRQMAVSVVPDRRKQAVIVSASREMMAEIEGVVKDLDEGNEGVQHVAAFDIGTADPAQVFETLSGLFMSTTKPNSANSTTLTQTPQTTRYTGNANAQTSAAQNAQTSTTSMGSKAP